MGVKVAILYICTGAYGMFWRPFYKSMESKFLPGIHKHYFVWSDKEVNEHNVTWRYRKYHGMPYDSLDRFSMFIEAGEELNNYDYVFYLNANTHIEKDVLAEDIFPGKSEFLVGTMHAYFWDKDTNKSLGGPFCKDRVSKAYINNSEKYSYIMGGFNGGITSNYMDMAKTIHEWTEIDKLNNSIPIRNDESYLNKYATLTPFKYLDPSYLHPEGWYIEGSDKKIIVLNKDYRIGNKKISMTACKGLRERIECDLQ